MRNTCRRLASTVVIASLLAPGFASAQTVTPILGNGATYRLDAKGNDVTSHKRPQNLNPGGISFSDCMADMSLGFPVSLSGFGGQSLGVWVGTQDCTTDAARGVGGAIPVCWKVAEIAALSVVTTLTTQINIRMQDIVGPHAAQPSTGTLVHETSSACEAQQTYSAVQFDIAFVPVDASGLLAGTPATFVVNTDLVGPPAPIGLSTAPGDGLLVLDWAPNGDPDTVGYDVYVASVAQLTSGGPLYDGGVTLVCDDGGDSGSCHYLAPALPPPGCGGALFFQTGLSDIGGISQVPTQWLVNANGTTTMTVSSPSVGNYDISGLVNNNHYAAVVSAVDAFGNIGPPSVEICDAPKAGTRTNPVVRTTGGCSCEVRGRGVPKRLSILATLLGACALGLFRHRRRSTLAASAQRAYTKPT